MHMTQEDRDILLGRIDARVEQLLEHHKDDRRRIASVERKLWYGQGALALAIAAILPKMRLWLGL